MSEQELQLLCFIIAMHIIVRDKIDPVLVDDEIQKIDEYRTGWSLHPATKIEFL